MQFASSKDGKKSILYLKSFSNLFFFVFFSRRQDQLHKSGSEKTNCERVRLSHSLTILGNSVYKQDRILFGYVCCEIAPV